MVGVEDEGLVKTKAFVIVRETHASHDRAALADALKELQ
ncbi:MAG: hypothetical protein U0235_24460 [Polyangiaceae bacterium]